MYSIEEFAQETAGIITEKLGGSYKAKTLAVEKINKGKCYAVVITDGEHNVSPSFYLEGFYSRYVSEGHTVAETAEKIIREYNSMEGVIKEDTRIAGYLSEEGWVRERLFLGLINKDKNKSFLNDAVHSDYAGLSLVLYVLVKDGMEGMAKIKVTKDICRGFGWDEKDTIAYALENTWRLFPLELCPLKRLIEMILNMEEEDIQAADSGIPGSGEDFLVLTNKKRIYGAAAIFYPGILKGIAEKKGTSLFLIPASIHEFIIIPDNGIYDQKGLENTLRETNSTGIAPDEILSDNLYYYNYETRELSVLGAGNEGTVIL